ncbi:MAG: hypothetical protein II304_07780 [Bacteroidales bacterium]|nr:hypothetical protein [Bacteroidales bacterium]
MRGDRKNKIFNSLDECPEEYYGDFSPNFVNIKGDTYNHLQVLYCVGFKNHRAEWLCHCNNCGKYVVVNSHNLRTGHTKSCGCLVSENLRKDLTGQTFGMLKVIKYDKSINENPYWIVECLNCGKIHSVVGDSLNRIESCGCLKSSKGEKIIVEQLQEFAKSTNRKLETQKTFDNCVFKAKLRFDFCINQITNHDSILIEYDGQQHYCPVKFGGISDSRAYKNFITTQVTDWYKDWYCITNNIPLIRIRYSDTKVLNFEQLYKNCYIVGKAQSSDKIIDVFDINEADFVNYKEATFNILSGISCTFKCGKDLCQNSTLAKSKPIRCNIDDIIKRYLDQDISRTITFQGLEVLDNIKSLLWFIYYFRKISNDTIIIWTGYTEDECADFIYLINKMNFTNIIIKFGRFIPNQQSHYDEVLGVHLASDNQKGVKIC